MNPDDPTQTVQANARSVVFERQPDGSFRAVASDRPPKPLAEIMAGLMDGLSPAARDASPPAESSPVQSPGAGALTERIYSDAGKRESRVDVWDERRSKKKKVTFASNSPASPVSPASPALPEEGEIVSGPETPGSGSSSGSHSSPEVMEGVLYPTAAEKNYGPYEGMPEWYKQVTALAERELNKRRPQEIIALEALKTCITRCEDAEKRHDPGLLEQLNEELRNHVHKAEVTLRMDKTKAKISRILTTQNGLPRIFSGSFPHDLKADAFQLYSRWWKGNFDQDLLRGIVTRKGKDRNGDRIDPKYREMYPSTAKFYGDEGFVLGQWWPTQLCTVRDGAHGAAQGGIFGDKENGAYSIVLSSGGYHDVDDGDSIEYSGTDGKAFTPTEATSQMITSAKLGNQIRVIRSAQLNRGNRFRPERGLRYDGLYVIKSYKEVDKEAQKYRFRLERCPGQAPIRCGDSNSRRPTIFEMDEYDKLKGKV